MPNDGGVSSAEGVRGLVARLKTEKRVPTDFEMAAVRSELDRMVSKVRKLRAMGPEFAAVDLSDEVWALVKISEKASVSQWSRSILRRIAATFLW